MSYFCYHKSVKYFLTKSQFCFGSFWLLFPGSNIIWCKADLSCARLHSRSLVFRKLLACRWRIRIRKTNPGHGCPWVLVSPALECEGQISWEDEPVIMLDDNHLAQESLSILLDPTFVKWYFKCVISSTISIIKTIFGSENKESCN